MNLRYSIVKTPLGNVFAAVNEGGALVELLFLGRRTVEDSVQRLQKAGHSLELNENALREVRTQIGEYFRGKRRQFDLPVHLEGTDFQRRVWNQLRGIGYGETISYGELALRVGAPRAARAVGRANATNPVALVIPCHRVIGQAGQLTGYGGGMEIKKALLVLEGALSPELPSFG